MTCKACQNTHYQNHSIIHALENQASKEKKLVNAQTFSHVQLVFVTLFVVVGVYFLGTY